MKKLKVKLKYCYGIHALDYEFDFSDKRTFAIYTPNGVMKTSFAKTFSDLSNGQESKDLVFPERDTERIITNEDGNEIKPEEVFVIEPYNEQFNSDKLSTLLVRKDLKDKYDDVYKELEIEKDSFIKKLKGISQSTDCETEFISTFITSNEENFFDLLSEITSQLDGKQTKYSFRYNDVFDKSGNVEKFLNKHKDSLDLYIENYKALISKSKIFKESNNTFGTYQASTILKSVSDNSFFEAGHSLDLTDSTKINSAEEFKALLENEIKTVVNDEQLKKVFDKVDKSIGANVGLRAFKAVIEEDNLLLTELKDYELFKEKVWLGYLDVLRTEVNTLVKFYSSKKAKLEDIISKAKDEKTDWEISIKEFNERFKGIPFKLSVGNKEDVMLKTSTPIVTFTFHDSEDETPIEITTLLEVLSQGERRALYLLNIIFEVQARKKLGLQTIFVVDDVADSFDYKNKYAIIEYLRDIAKEEIFFQIILTHNFDFFRSVSGRIIGNGGNDRKYKLNVIKTENKIKIIQEKYQNNPFEYWKKHLDNNVMLIASIPFIRNLAEYTGYKKQDEHADDQEYEKLTSLLHIKSDTEDLTVQDLEDIFKVILKDRGSLSLLDTSKKIIDLIFELADEITGNSEEVIELESKIVLSIAIRLKAEKFMIKKIDDQDFVDQISRNQTIELIKKFKELFPDDEGNINLLEQVNLMTPENIHLNSFMYEPILDLGNKHLKSLYKDIN